MLNRLHRYLGLGLALFVLITSLTGALLLWSDEYHQWRYPALAKFAQAPPPDAAVLETITATSATPVRAIILPSDGLPAYHLYMFDESQALHHPLDGSPVARWQPLESLPSFLFELHVRLLSGEPGHILIGVVGLALLLMMGTGATVWWRRRKLFRLRRWLPKRSSAPVLINAHAAQGVMLGVLLAVIALTGAGMVFHDQAEALLKTLPGSSRYTRPEVTAVSGAETQVNWAAALATAARAFPQARPRIAMLPEEPGRPLVLRLKQAAELHSNGRSYLVLHPQTGAVLERIDATQTGPGPAAYNALYPLHAGKTGWPGYRLVLLMVALAAGYLAFSGGWVYFRRLRSGRESAR